MPEPGDPAALKKAFSRFPTGVTVVGARDQSGAPHGFTASAFTPVSLDPPLLLVCVGYASRSASVFAKAETFAVSVLTHAQDAISTRFATPGAERFSITPWEPKTTGAPVLVETAGWFDCTVHDRVDAGDHFLLLGRIEALGGPDDAPAPLGYWRSGYCDVTSREQV